MFLEVQVRIKDYTQISGLMVELKTHLILSHNCCRSLKLMNMSVVLWG